MSRALIESQPSAQRGSPHRADAWWAVAVCGGLVLAVALAFGQALRHGFLNWDDGFFVCGEPHVTGGLSWSGIAWAFTNGPAGEWYPLSMLSHMLDCQLHGLRPAGHHLTNLLLHAATSVALFLVLWRMTGALWPSALVAALFALHPLRVESVAWVAERRDVLSGLFFMLTLGAYGEYVRHSGSLWRYLSVVGLFAFGLLAKPIVVTLPALLLLLDFWPLRRMGQTQPEEAAWTARPAFSWRLIVEKLPLFALSIAVAVVTMRTHSPHPNPLPLPDRLANAPVACVAYLGQLFVPANLSIFYPHPEAGRPAWQVAAALALLLAITVRAVIWRRSYPDFFVGWFWYVGMLSPVLGLTYVGPESRADRYTYLSQIGLSIALVWGSARLGAWLPARRWVFGIGSAVVLAALMACSWHQVGYWQDDKTLWEHALACDPKNVTAHYSLGIVLAETDTDGAVAQYEQALQIGPNERNIYRRIRALAHTDLGNIAAQKMDAAGAIAHYEQAIEADPNFAPPHMNLGIVRATDGDFDQATAHFQRCIELAPDDAAIAYGNLALKQSQGGKPGEAIANCRKALEADPDFGVAHAQLASLLAARGDVDEAVEHFRRAIEIEPADADPCNQLAELLRKQGKTSEAARYVERGRKASRRYAETQIRRGTGLAQQGKIDQAIATFQIAVTIAPDNARAHHNLADALASQGNVERAVAHYRRALEIDPNLAAAKQSLEQLLNR
ncbi:MAG TPA: tetratricopeptide repeat protein [Pirellulales bacterium]|jgi:tetratricopeptide (TPR) repeat protein|nr:tetratricopeptide repeat protein [Pirellulales bacterium]